VDLEVGVSQILLKLAPQVDGSMLQLGHLDPGVVLILPGNAEILHNIVRLFRKGAVDLQCPFGIRLGQLEEVS